MIKISKTIKQNIRFVTKVSNLSPNGIRFLTKVSNLPPIGIRFLTKVSNLPPIGIRFDEVKTGNRLANQRSTPKGAKVKFDERTPN